MASDELMKSWERTEGFLRDARSHISEVAEACCEDEIHEFEKYLQHNELELALDALDSIFDKSRKFVSWRVVELMAMAAASMELFERQQHYDDQLTKARGWKYVTVLPS